MTPKTPASVMPLLLHSMGEYWPIIEQILATIAPNKVTEIGSEFGGLTSRLLEYCCAHNCHLISIEPAPTQQMQSLLAAYPTIFSLIETISHNALVRDDITGTSIFFIDGDHNYWTVKRELELIAKNHPNAICLMHDVGFPCDRRDMYYSPITIPAGQLHSFSYTKGVTLDSDVLVDGGFNSCGNYAIADHANTPRNGVLTAIEDFIAENGGYELTKIAPVFGLGLLIPTSHPHKNTLRSLLMPYSNEMIERLERNRIMLYLRVLELQKSDITLARYRSIINFLEKFRVYYRKFFK